VLDLGFFIVDSGGFRWRFASFLFFLFCFRYGMLVIKDCAGVSFSPSYLFCPFPA